MPTALTKPISCSFHRPLTFYVTPVLRQYLTISGVTKDSTGSPLSGCTVKLFRTVDDQLVGTQISDANGNYSFFNVVGGGLQYYVEAYKAGSPDVAGTTVNTLVGA